MRRSEVTHAVRLALGRTGDVRTILAGMASGKVAPPWARAYVAGYHAGRAGTVDVDLDLVHGDLVPLKRR